jgi:thiamine monophosphate synthase
VAFSELASLYAMPIYALGGLKKSHLNTAYYAGAQGICGISAFLAT